MRQWQFNVAFIVVLGLLIFFSVAPYFGLNATPNPIVVTGFGLILGYIFTKKDTFLEHKTDKQDKLSQGDSTDSDDTDDA